MAQLIEFEGAQHEFPDDFTDADISGALRKVSTPTGQANRALAGTGLSVSQPKPPSAIPNFPGDDSPPMSTGQMVGAAGKQLLGAAVSPITGIPGAVSEVADWAKGGFHAPALNSDGSAGAPDYMRSNPLTEAQGGAMLAVGTTPGVPQALAGGAKSAARKTSNAVRTAVSTPGTGRMIAGGLEAGGGLAAMAGGQPLYGGAALARGVWDFKTGLDKRAASRIPPPRQTAAPPPVQGSNARPLPPPRPQVAPPPIQGSNAPPLPPPPAQAAAGPPPVRWDKTPKATAKQPGPAGPPRGPKLPVKWNPAEAEAAAGPPKPPASAPQAGPPPPSAAPVPESGSAYPGPEGSPPNYTAPKEHYMQAARTVRGKAMGRLFRDDAVPPEEFGTWKVGDPRWKQAASDAGVTPPNSPESIQAIMDEFRKLPPKKNGVPKMAQGGVVAPMGREKVRGMAHRWGPKGRN